MKHVLSIFIKTNFHARSYIGWVKTLKKIRTNPNFQENFIKDNCKCEFSKSKGTIKNIPLKAGHVCNVLTRAPVSSELIVI